MTIICRSGFRCENCGLTFWYPGAATITTSEPFKWRHYPGEVILRCVRWYLRYPISYLHMSEMMRERGLEIDPSCIWRWVQQYGPELEKRCRPHLKPTNKSYRVDETYIRGIYLPREIAA